MQLLCSCGPPRLSLIKSISCSIIITYRKHDKFYTKLNLGDKKKKLKSREIFTIARPSLSAARRFTCFYLYTSIVVVIRAGEQKDNNDLIITSLNSSIFSKIIDSRLKNLSVEFTLGINQKDEDEHMRASHSMK